MQLNPGGSDPFGGAKTLDLMAGEQQDPALRPRGLESQKFGCWGSIQKRWPRRSGGSAGRWKEVVMKWMSRRRMDWGPGTCSACQRLLVGLLMGRTSCWRDFGSKGTLPDSSGLGLSSPNLGVGPGQLRGGMLSPVRPCRAPFLPRGREENPKKPPSHPVFWVPSSPVHPFPGRVWV